MATGTISPVAVLRDAHILRQVGRFPWEHRI